jgi:hypothetical protein
MRARTRWALPYIIPRTPDISLNRVALSPHRFSHRVRSLRGTLERYRHQSDFYRFRVNLRVSPR